MTANHADFDAFVSTIAALRAPDGCPWDKEQTHESIAKNMIEEAYEVVDAIEARSVEHLREELGDVLLQIVLQSQIAADEGEFTIDDVCADINAKMIRRHPHVFGDASVEDANGVMDLWEQVKLAEKEAVTARQAAQHIPNTQADEAEEGSNAQPAEAFRGLLDDTPRTFPALMECQKISRKAAAAGFEWDTIDDVWAKVEEEASELREAYDAAPKSANGKIDGKTELGREVKRAAEVELGDVLFAVVNIGRRMGLDAESALRASNAKFRARWSAMERVAWDQGRAIEDCSTAEQNDLWDEVKLRLSAENNSRG